MENGTSALHDEMTRTRSDLTEKLEALENRVAGTVAETTEAVSETVSAVTETVQSTVETVKETFDVRSHVRNHPWASLAASVLVGYIGTKMLSSATSVVSNAIPSGPAPAPSATPAYSPAHANASNDSGWFDALEPVTKTLRELAIGTTTGLLGQMAVQVFPDEVRHQVTDSLDSMTRALGGKPMKFDTPNKDPNLP